MLDRERYEALLDLGIAVHRMGDVYETDREGQPLTEAVQRQWFVSALAASDLVEPVCKIPLADTEGEAWELAAQHLLG
ncbi:hypothetical protein [Candidatus Burkholderia verschuerenii]|uniref:hypothetical protein n=1 Tax=Candidatus Burkholderia verschuerenii TaxID=242163 RepID=UPI00067CCE81|nr:hypothetical protein [Candidatus Burkholderia verschuerenii]